VNRISEFAVLVDGLDHSEDVVRGPDGEVYAGGEAGQLYRVDVAAGTATELASTGGFLLGIVLDGEGRVYGCDIVRQEVVRIDIETATVESYSRGAPDAPAVLPNGLVFAADGTLYFSDSGEWQQNDGRIYAVSPAGETRIWSTAAAAFPNGLALDSDGCWLYVVESALPGVSRIEVLADGSAGEREVLAEMPDTFPDGVTLTDDGNLLIGCYAPDVIYVLRPGGSPEVLAGDTIRMTLNSPVNCTFGGPNADVLVVSNLGRKHLCRADLGMRGAPVNYPVLASRTSA
jgi:gluconolactonase